MLVDISRPDFWLHPVCIRFFVVVAVLKNEYEAMNDDDEGRVSMAARLMDGVGILWRVRFVDGDASLTRRESVHFALNAFETAQPPAAPDELPGVDDEPDLWHLVHYVRLAGVIDGGADALVAHGNELINLRGGGGADGVRRRLVEALADFDELANAFEGEEVEEEGIIDLDRFMFDREGDVYDLWNAFDGDEVEEEGIIDLNRIMLDGDEG